jgi:hypothetical protein
MSSFVGTLDVIFGEETRDQAASGGGLLTWRHTISPRTSLALAGGMNVNHFLEQERTVYSPAGSITHASTWEGKRQVWTSSLSGGVQNFLDRLNGAYESQVYASFSLNGQIGRDFSTGSELFASTVVSRPTAVDDQGTFLRLSLPSTYRVTLNSDFLFGARFLVRAAHLRAVEPPPLELEVIGYIGYGVTFGMKEDQGSWL